MEYIHIGKIVNTHGIKGELRIISDFKFKAKVFKPGNTIYIGDRYQQQELKSYRIHKEYDMVTFKGVSDINEVLIFKGEDVYINRASFDFDGYLDEDIIGLEVYDNSKYLGKVDSIMKNKAHPILVIVKENKRNLIPFIDEFILSVDIDSKKVNVKVIEGLIDED